MDVTDQEVAGVLECCGAPPNTMKTIDILQARHNSSDRHCGRLDLHLPFLPWRPSLSVKDAGFPSCEDMSEDDRFLVRIDPMEVGQLKWAISPISLNKSRLKFAIGDFSDQLGINTEHLESRMKEINLAASEAVRVLSDHPRYCSWVSLVTHGIAASYSKGNRSASASSSLLPGIYHCEFGVPPVEIAETLVHESAHQWFFVAERITCLVNGSDNQEYYSPFKGKKRGIRIIFLTYHAFANVLLFLTGVDNRTPGQFELADRIGDLTADLRKIEEPLEITTGLTFAGRKIFDDLKCRVNHLDFHC